MVKSCGKSLFFKTESSGTGRYFYYELNIDFYLLECTKYELSEIPQKVRGKN